MALQAAKASSDQVFFFLSSGRLSEILTSNLFSSFSFVLSFLGGPASGEREFGRVRVGPCELGASLAVKQGCHHLSNLGILMVVVVGNELLRS